MIKQLTGVKFTPKEFRKLNYCISCSVMLNIPKGKKCNECLEKHFIHCEVCEIILQRGIKKHYSYDIRDEVRNDDMAHKISKEMVREFLETEEVNNKHSETLCTDCVNFEKRIKNKCWTCDSEFINSVENYKLNGNMCVRCSYTFS